MSQSGTRRVYIQTLYQSGVSLKTLQLLARHADLKTTLRIYVHVTESDKEAALEALPDLTEMIGRSSEALGEAPGVPPINEPLATHLPLAGDVSSQNVAGSGGTQDARPEAAAYRNSLDTNEKDASRHDLAASVASAPRRTRTYNPLIKSQLLCQLS
jgi:hypothetical protein